MLSSHCFVYEHSDFCRYLSTVVTAPLLYKNPEKDILFCAFTLLTATEERNIYFCDFDPFTML